MNIDLIQSRVSVKEAFIAREVSRTHSVRNTARILDMKAAVVSRIISDLERKMGFKVFSRSQVGVKLTPLGEKLLSAFESFLADLEQLGEHKKGNDEIKICATSFLNTHLSSKCVVPFFLANSKRPYLLDVSPDQLIPFSIRNAFELAVHFESQKWPGTWVQKKVAKVPWVLCVSKKSKIPKDCSLEQIEDLKFSYPVYYSENGIHFGNDFCPLSKNQRNIGIYTATADSALMSIMHSDLVAFLPKILVDSHEDQVKILSPRGWEPVYRNLYLSVKSDIVSNKIFNELGEIMRDFCE